MKLSAIIALEKGTKERVYQEISTLYHAIQKPELFNGFNKTYRPKEENGETYPPESKRIQMGAGDALDSLRKLRTEAFDLTATKDVGNCSARADVVIDGTVVLANLPATFLLYLEKQLDEIHKFVSELPTLDQAEDWHADPNSGMYRTEPTETYRTKKEQRAIVLYDATKEHPAQTQLITEDQVVGYWTTVKHSAAAPAPRKKELLDRVQKLRDAVKVARETANGVEVERQPVGEKIFDFLLK